MATIVAAALLRTFRCKLVCGPERAREAKMSLEHDGGIDLRITFGLDLGFDSSFLKSEVAMSHQFYTANRLNPSPSSHTTATTPSMPNFVVALFAFGNRFRSPIVACFRTPCSISCVR